MFKWLLIITLQIELGNYSKAVSHYKFLKNQFFLVNFSIINVNLNLKKLFGIKDFKKIYMKGLAILIIKMTKKLIFFSLS